MVPVSLSERLVIGLPALEISLSVKDLILKVPLFAALTEDQADALALQVTPVVFLPGEVVCSVSVVGGGTGLSGRGFTGEKWIVASGGRSQSHLHR